MADSSTKVTRTVDKQESISSDADCASLHVEIAELKAKLDTSIFHYERLVTELKESRDEWRQVVITLSYPEGSFQGRA